MSYGWFTLHYKSAPTCDRQLPDGQFSNFLKQPATAYPTVTVAAARDLCERAFSFRSSQFY